MTKILAKKSAHCLTVLLLASVAFSNNSALAKPDDNSAAQAAQTSLQHVAHFDHQVTGVTVSKDGRIFVNFPRWTEDAPISVAEVGKDGALKAYPDEEWNSWRNTNKNEKTTIDHFVSVQSVVTDNQGNLWVLDPAAPGNERVVPGGPKLVKIDLASNKVTKTIAFDEKAAPQGSYLNDVRFSQDSNFAYLSDSGKPALIVVNLKTGQIRRVLENDKSTKVEKDVVVKTDGKELRRPDGRAPEFNADGIALSADGKYFYWQALTAKTLYRVPTAALNNSQISVKNLAAKVETVGENGVADGLWIDKKDRMYITSLEDNSIKIRDGKSAPAILVQDEKLRWPDTLSEDANGAIYVTTSRIQDSPWFKPDADKAVPTDLWRIDPAVKK